MEIQLTQLVLNSLISGCSYALVGLGFALIYRTNRFFDFSYGALISLGAYVMFLLWRIADLPGYLAALISVLVCAFIRGAAEAVVFRPIRRRGTQSVVPMVASLGILILLQNILSALAGDETRRLRATSETPVFDVLGGRITLVQVVILFVSMLLYAMVIGVMFKTRWGQTVRAVSNDPDLAQVVGIKSDAVVFEACGAGAALAGIAGILIGCDIDVTPAMGFHVLLMGVVAVVVGGLESIVGAAVGGLVIGFVRSFGVAHLATHWQDAIVFSVLVAVLLLKPTGLLGKARNQSVA